MAKKRKEGVSLNEVALDPGGGGGGGLWASVRNSVRR